MLALFTLASCKDKLATQPPTTVPSDTIAHWTFSGNLSDVTGNGHDGTLLGAQNCDLVGYVADRFGHPNSAFYFTCDAYVSVANKADINFSGNDSYTISAWVETSVIADAGIISKGPSDGSHPGYQIIEDKSGARAGWSAFWVTDASNTSQGFGDGAFVDSSWHLITVAVTAHSGIAVYKDSALQGFYTDGAMEPELDNVAPLLFGVDPTKTKYFTGVLDDIILYNRALDPAEVSSRFHEGGWYVHHDTTVITTGSWNPSSSGTSEDLVIGQFVNSTTGFVSGLAGAFLATGDAGTTWNLRSSAPVFSGTNTGAIYGLSFFDAQTGFAAGEQRDISMTTDGGLNWNPMDASNVPSTELIRSLYFIDRNTGFVGTSDAYTGGPSGSICQTTDGGQTWNPIFHTQGGIYNIDFNIPGSNGMNGIALGRYGVAYWTTDRGTTWKAGSTDQTGSLIARSTFTSATTGFAVATAIADNVHGNILRTDDAGHTWHTVYSLPLGLCGIASNGNGTITAVGFGGVIIESTDGGTTWSQSNAGTSRWIDIRYASQGRAVLFGVNGKIVTRNK